jgi:maleylpyruvate isomerase
MLLYLSRSAFIGKFCVDDHPTIADCVLVPQMFSAARLGVEVSPFETLKSIGAACDVLPAFAAEHPAKEIDRE